MTLLSRLRRGGTGGASEGAVDAVVVAVTGSADLVLDNAGGSE